MRTTSTVFIKCSRQRTRRRIRATLETLRTQHLRTYKKATQLLYCCRLIVTKKSDTPPQDSRQSHSGSPRRVPYRLPLVVSTGRNGQGLSLRGCRFGSKALLKSATAVRATDISRSSVLRETTSVKIVLEEPTAEQGTERNSAETVAHKAKKVVGGLSM